MNKSKLLFPILKADTYCICESKPIFIVVVLIFEDPISLSELSSIILYTKIILEDHSLMKIIEWSLVFIVEILPI